LTTSAQKVFSADLRQQQLGGEQPLSPSYRQFIESIKTDATKADYLKGLKAFMQFLRVKTHDYDALLFDDNVKVIQSHIVDFIICCKNVRELSPAAIDMYTAAIKKFYVQNDILLNWKKINSYKPEFCRVVEDVAYSREQIAIMVAVAGDLRDKAILLLLASTGIRIGAVPKLRLKDVVPIDIVSRQKIYQVTVYKKAKQQYICYTTFEAYDAISAYIEYRKRCGEPTVEVEDEEGNKKRVLKPESPLFRKVFDRR
jgi:integrase